MCGLFERGARLAGDELFGLRLGERMRPEDFGPWIRYAQKGESLAAMLARTIRAIQYHQPGAASEVSVEGQAAIWRYRPSMRAAQRYRQHVDHIIWTKIRLVRRFAGPEWKPLWIEVGYDRPCDSGRLEDALRIRVAFGKSSASVGIAIPRDLVDDISNIHPGSVPAVRDLRAILAARTPYATSDIVRELFLFGDEDHERGLTNIARILRVSPRTLQRALQAEGRSFSELLEIARFDEARKLLSTDMRVADVSAFLGYSYPPNFTRAFHEWAGVSPVEFRLGDEGRSGRDARSLCETDLV